MNSAFSGLHAFRVMGYLDGLYGTCVLGSQLRLAPDFAESWAYKTD